MVKSKVLRVILIIVGFISLGLGCVGIALPILPTVPFFLLTSFCFVKSSKRFNTWFLNSKLYKKHVENFATTKSMILRNELILLLSVSAMLMTTMYFVNKLAVTIILSILIGCKYLYFIWQVKPISKPEWQIMQLGRLRAKEKEEQDKIIAQHQEEGYEPKKKNTKVIKNRKSKKGGK